MYISDALLYEKSGELSHCQVNACGGACACTVRVPARVAASLPGIRSACGLVRWAGWAMAMLSSRMGWWLKRIGPDLCQGFNALFIAEPPGASSVVCWCSV